MAEISGQLALARHDNTLRSHFSACEKPTIYISFNWLNQDNLTELETV